MNKLLPLRTRLKRLQIDQGVRWEILEKDYFLSWILYAIAQDPSLSIVFKGGTALKKCYFGSYRFSEDLDFTALKKAPKNFENSFEKVLQRLSDQINMIEPFKGTCEKYKEKLPHPEDQEAYLFKGMFDWHRASHVKVLVEISRDEKFCLEPMYRKVYHEYGEKLEAEVLCYSLEEIILEKLRAILQNTQKIHEREWSRSRVRDYYDIWKIFTTYNKDIDTTNLKIHLKTKCSIKKVSYLDSSSFFDETMITLVKKEWKRWLEPLVPELPPCEFVLGEMKDQISKFLD